MLRGFAGYLAVGTKATAIAIKTVFILNSYCFYVLFLESLCLPGSILAFIGYIIYAIPAFAVFRVIRIAGLPYIQCPAIGFALGAFLFGTVGGFRRAPYYLTHIQSKEQQCNSQQ